MKFSAALALGVAPVALAKAAHNVQPVRREPGRHASKSAARNLGSVGSSLATVDPLLLSQLGLTLGSQTDIIVIWVNQGFGANTQNINPVQTVTQTVTQQAGGQAVNTGAVGAAPTLQPLGGGQGQQGVGAGQQGVGAGQAIQAPPGAQVGANGRPPIPVLVGGPKGIQFEPQEVTAQIGDMIIFTFLSTNHTVTQSAFDTPCQPLAQGMDTGFQPNPDNNVTSPPQIAMQVMVDTPLWFYCRQNNHCGKGMVFSVNAAPAKTHAMFQSMAIAQAGTTLGGSAITGSGGAAAAGNNTVAPPPDQLQQTPPAGSNLPAAGGAASGTLGQLPPVDTAGAVLPQGTGSVVAGTGQLLANGECSCVVECAAGSFPAVQAQGVGNFGGMAGQVPASMVGLR